MSPCSCVSRGSCARFDAACRRHVGIWQGRDKASLERERGGGRGGAELPPLCTGEHLLCFSICQTPYPFRRASFTPLQKVGIRDSTGGGKGLDGSRDLGGGARLPLAFGGWKRIGSRWHRGLWMWPDDTCRLLKLLSCTWASFFRDAAS